MKVTTGKIAIESMGRGDCDGLTELSGAKNGYRKALTDCLANFDDMHGLFIRMKLPDNIGINVEISVSAKEWLREVASRIGLSKTSAGLETETWGKGCLCHSCQSNPSVDLCLVAFWAWLEGWTPEQFVNEIREIRVALWRAGKTPCIW